MTNQDKTKEELAHELEKLRLGVAELESAQAEQYLDVASVMILALNGKGEVTLINRYGEQILGFSRDEIIGRNWFDNFLPERDRDRVKTVFLRIMAGEVESAGSFENPVLTRSGEERLIAWYNTILTNESGELIGTLSSGVDINDRNMAERSLHFEKERLLNLLELIPGFVYLQEPNYSIRFANRKFRELFGDPQDRPCYQVLWGRDEPCEVCPTFEVFKTKSGKEWEWTSNDGQTYLIYDSLFVDSDGSELVLEMGMDITDRKKAEDALRESEARYRLIIENANDGILVAQDWLSKSCNPRFALMTGYELEELVEQPLTIWIHPEDVDMVFARHKQRTSGVPSLPTNYQFRILRKDGKSLWTELNTKLIEWQGRPATLNIFRDITERKRTDEALRESEERLDLALQGADLGLWDLDVKSGKGVVNERAAQMTGYELHELDQTMSSFERICHPDDKDRVLLAMSNHLNGRSPAFAEEHRIRTKSGELKWILSRGKVVERDEDGNAVRMAGTFLDVTRRKKSEIALRRLATAVEQAEEAIEITDRAGTIHYINPAFERITGYSRAEALGGKPSILKSGEHDEAFYRNLWSTITQGKVWRGRFVNRRKDGSLYREDATISPVRDRSGNIVNFVAVKRDVTQELALQEQLLHAQKMEAIGTLAGGIAHEFNNILQVTLGFSELLLSERTEQDPEYADLQNIVQAAKSGADLVQRMLTFSRRIERKPIPLKVNRRVQEIKEILRRTIPRMIDIELDLSEQVDEINVDPNQLEQILMNLAVNARDAMPDGGKLIIRTETIQLDEAYCGTHAGVKPGRYVALTISDNGHGMGQQTLEHIFEPFYTTKEIGRGTGLGLAMVYGIVQQHGGHITCESKPGQGTRFQIYLPALEIEQLHDVRETAEIPAFGTETVLLIDDEGLIRDLGERILTRNGYTVLTAGNGKEALDLYKREKDRIDLVILDLIMPEMGGMQCLEEILKINPNAKVLVASGHSGDLPTEGSLEIGAKGFVGKPFRVKDLLRDVRKVLNKED